MITPSLISWRKKPKVLLYPRKKQFIRSNQATVDNMITALKIPTSERSEQDVDTILSVVGTWPKFTDSVHTEQMRREVCRHMVYEEYQPNTILFKQNDDPNGWFIVVQGNFAVVILVPTDQWMGPIPPLMVSILRNEFGHDKNFRVVANKPPKDEIGSTALIKNQKRNATIFATEPSIVIRIDNQIYRDTAAFFARTQLEKRSNLFSHVSEFHVLFEQGNGGEDPLSSFVRLAENTIDINLPAGTIIDLEHTGSITKKINNNDKSKTQDQLNLEQENENKALFIVAEGKLIMYRRIEFPDNQEKQSNDNQKKMTVKVPKGPRLVEIKSLGPRSLFADPRLDEKWILHPFTLKVVEPVLLHKLKISDLMGALRIEKVIGIQEQMRKQPNDQEIMEEWIEKQEQAQWLEFKKQCVKEARRAVKLEKQIMNGTLGMRKAGPPKSIKSHAPFAPLKANDPY